MSKGFSLLEVVIATIFLSLVLLSAFEFLHYQTRLMNTLILRTHAINILKNISDLHQTFLNHSINNNAVYIGKQRWLNEEEKNGLYSFEIFNNERTQILKLCFNNLMIHSSTSAPCETWKLIPF